MFASRVFMDRNNITLFLLKWENTCIDELFKIMAYDTMIAGPQIDNIRMLMLSWPSALHESKF